MTDTRGTDYCVVYLQKGFHSNHDSIEYCTNIRSTFVLYISLDLMVYSCVNFYNVF